MGWMNFGVYFVFVVKKTQLRLLEWSSPDFTLYTSVTMHSYKSILVMSFFYSSSGLESHTGHRGRGPCCPGLGLSALQKLSIDSSMKVPCGK